MKINGLLGLLSLLISILSVGSLAEAQVISASQGCPNCSPAVSFPSASTFTSETQVVGQPIYQDSSVVPATYMAPAPASASTTGTSIQYSVPTIQQPAQQVTSSSFTQQSAGSGLAQSKASRAAQMQLRGHLGGGFGNAKYEGVGWSNRSAQSAIQSCCYWGSRPVSQIGVAKSNDGCWYACVLYN